MQRTSKAEKAALDNASSKEDNQNKDDSDNDAYYGDHLGVLPPVLACHLLRGSLEMF